MKERVERESNGKNEQEANREKDDQMVKGGSGNKSLPPPDPPRISHIVENMHETFMPP